VKFTAFPGRDGAVVDTKTAQRTRPTTASPWPARCAYLSSIIFIAASGTTNIVFGFSKGDSFATSCVWAGVAGAVAIILPLSWPALIRSLDAKRWSELEALIRRGCPTNPVLSGQAKTSCPKYDVELARSWERQRLTSGITDLSKDAERAEQRLAERRDRTQTTMEKASAQLARIQPARIANSDAKALTRYLGALGLEIGPDRLNDLLVLLAVIMVEVGGGLSLAVGMALSWAPGSATAALPSAVSVEAENAASERARRRSVRSCGRASGGVRPVSTDNRPAIRADSLVAPTGWTR